MLTAALEGLARDIAIPMTSIWLGAHAAVLVALTGQREVTAGYIPVPGAGPVPCRLDTPIGTWRAMLSAVDHMRAQVTEHHDHPIDELRQELGTTGPRSETIVDGCPPASASGTTNLTTPTPQNPPADLPEDTVLRLGVLSNGHTLRLTYQRDTLDADAAARIADYHLTALRQMITDPDAEHSMYSLISAEEHRFQIDTLAGPTRDLPDRCFHQLFQRRASHHPHAVAAAHGAQTWTYRELNTRANKIGQSLLSRGLPPQAVVAVVTERNLDWLATVIAIFKAGAAYLPVEPHFPPDRIATTIDRTGCRFVITEHSSSRNVDRALRAHSTAERLLIEDLYAEDHPDGDLDIDVTADQLAYIHLTSGSTEEPTGTMCEHAGMLNHLYAKIIDLRIGALPQTDQDWETPLEPAPHVVVAQTAPRCFDTALWQLLSALLVGGRTLLVEQHALLDVARFVSTIERAQVSTLQVVPAYLDELARYLEHDPRDLPALNCVAVTGATLNHELARRWFALRPGNRLVTTHGHPETSNDTTHEVIDRAPDQHRGPLGSPVINTRVYVVNEHLDPVPLGAQGEIVYSGVCVARGYIRDETGTAAFRADPHRPGERLYRSGILGRWLPDGKLELLGGRDNPVTISGVPVEIEQIESALRAVPGVRDGAVLALGDSQPRRLVAFYTGQHMPVQDLRQRLGVALLPHMVPSTVVWRAELPLTPNGTIDRGALPEMAADIDNPDQQTDPEHGPRTRTEHRLAAAWAIALEVPVDDIKRTDNFYDRGGTAQAAATLAHLLDRAATPEDLTRHPVLAELAHLIDTTP
jgi:amino acid adenylation domain-containing protein